VLLVVVVFVFFLNHVVACLFVISLKNSAVPGVCIKKKKGNLEWEDLPSRFEKICGGIAQSSNGDFEVKIAYGTQISFSHQLSPLNPLILCCERPEG